MFTDLPEKGFTPTIREHVFDGNPCKHEFWVRICDNDKKFYNDKQESI